MGRPFVITRFLNWLSGGGLRASVAAMVGAARAFAGAVSEREAQGCITISGLKKSFGAVKAVQGVDISIARGQTIVLLGPNGAGKTTMIDMLLGLLRPDSGENSVFGRPPAEAVRNGLVGGMLQVGTLVKDLKVRELVAMVAALYPRPLDVDKALELAGIDEIADRRTNNLSGGQTQRVRFAIGIVGDPELLVLDEPTVALDVEGRRDFWVSMRGVAARGKTVLLPLTTSRRPTPTRTGSCSWPGARWWPTAPRQRSRPTSAPGPSGARCRGQTCPYWVPSRASRPRRRMATASSCGAQTLTPRCVPCWPASAMPVT